MLPCVYKNDRVRRWKCEQKDLHAFTQYGTEFSTFFGIKASTSSSVVLGLNKHYISVNLLTEWLSWIVNQSPYSRIWGQYAFIISLCVVSVARPPKHLNEIQWNQILLNASNAALKKCSFLIMLPCREKVKWLDVCEWLRWWKCG